MINTNHVIGTHNVVFITLDTLRFDVAQACFLEGRTPNFANVLPPEGWQQRHSPGNFTFAAHQAFFAGFLPTPTTPGKHPRRFALEFPGSETTTEETCLFNTPNVITGFAQRDYHTICIGGVGFFNKLTPLGRVMPDLFHESHWSPKLGVTDRHSTENQINVVREALSDLPVEKRAFVFLNVSAIHQPNCFYLSGATEDTLQSHAAALEYVDRCLPTLFDLLRERGPTFCIVCSDHGTAYGEDGYHGHRLSHPVVWNVPYGEFVLS